jgi:hypothetical protein
MNPSVGRVVHYQSYGTPNGEFKSEARAAVITTVAEAHDDRHCRVGLAVLNPTGLFFEDPVPYSEEPQAGHWSWPPRV